MVADKFLARQVGWGCAQAVDHIHHVLLLQRLGDAGAHGVDHMGWRAGGRVDAKQRVSIKTGQTAFSQGGHVGVERRALWAANGQQLELAGFDLLEAWARIKPELQLAAEHIGQRRACALVGDVGGFNAGCALEHFTGQVRRATGAGRAIGCLAGVGLQVLDELGHVVGGHAGVGFQKHVHARHGGHGRQVLVRVKGQLAVNQRVDADRTARAQQQGIAILGSAHGFADADVAVGAGLVVHHHGLTQHLAHGRGDGAGQHVGSTAGGKVDDQANRAFRPFVVGQHRGCNGRAQHCQQAGAAQTVNEWLWGHL